MSDETDSRYGRTRAATTVSVTPTQVAAARVRVAGDRQLDRDTPPWIKRLAEAVRPTTTGGEADEGPPVKDRDGNVWRWHREPDTGDEWEQVWVCCGGPYIERPHGHYADCPTTADPAPSVTPDSDQLSEVLARHQMRFEPVQATWGRRWAAVGCSCGWVLDGVTPFDQHQAAALLSGPVGQLLREHTERGEKLERVQAAIDRHADNLSPTQRAAFVRALDGGA